MTPVQKSGQRSLGMEIKGRSSRRKLHGASVKKEEAVTVSPRHVEGPVGSRGHPQPACRVRWPGLESLPATK
jgi:hypothetical protein